MRYYDYHEWIHWPESDVREYAREIAAAQSLAADDANYLERQMAWKAGYWPDIYKPGPAGPRKMDAEMEEQFRSMGDDDEAIFNHNCSINEPKIYMRPKYDVDITEKTIGIGLTRRRLAEVKPKNRTAKQWQYEQKKRIANDPFRHLHHRVRLLANEAHWQANCYPTSGGNWLIKKGNDEPYKGLVWYSNQLFEVFNNALNQMKIGNIQAAMLHAFRVGELCSQLEIRMVHGVTYEKYEAVKIAQSDAAQSRKIIPDELRRETYWRYRHEGNKRIESGRSAALELGLSEPSIRNAFPGKKYPTE